MSVIKKVDEKVAIVIATLPEDYTDKDFVSAFREMYPADYDRSMNKYLSEERKTKPGKRHPMQYPNKHIISALHSYISRKKH